MRIAQAAGDSGADHHQAAIDLIDHILFREGLPEVGPASARRLAVSGRIGRNCEQKTINKDRMVLCEGSEVNMRQPALSLAWAAASHPRFAVITALLAFTTLPLMAQEKPIPAELSFLNKIGKPYRTTYELWTEMQADGESCDRGRFSQAGSAAPFKIR